METKIKTAFEVKEQLNTSIPKVNVIKAINSQIIPENYNRVLYTNEFAFNIKLPYHLPWEMRDQITSELEETWNIRKFNNTSQGHCFLQIQFKEEEENTAFDKVRTAQALEILKADNPHFLAQLELAAKIKQTAPDEFTGGWEVLQAMYVEDISTTLDDRTTTSLDDQNINLNQEGKQNEN